MHTKSLRRDHAPVSIAVLMIPRYPFSTVVLKYESLKVSITKTLHFVTFQVATLYAAGRRVLAMAASSALARKASRHARAH